MKKMIQTIGFKVPLFILFVGLMIQFHQAVMLINEENNRANNASVQKQKVDFTGSAIQPADFTCNVMQDLEY